MGVFDADGKLKEIYGTVTGAGTYNGQSVIFLDDGDTPYFLSSIMAVGKLPEPKPDDKTENEDGDKPTEGVDKPAEGGDKPPESTDKPDGDKTDAAGGTDAPATNSGTAQDPLPI